MPEFYSPEKSGYTRKKDRDYSDRSTPREDFESVRTFLTWTAAARPFRKKDRSYYTTIAIIVVLVILILFFIREFILMGVVLAIAFVAYVLGFVSPEDVEYKISTQGVTIGDHFYFWQDLDSFWFADKDGFKILHILTNLRFPGQLMILIKPEDQDHIKNSVARYLPFHEIAPKSLMDTWAEGLQKHFPMENPQH